MNKRRLALFCALILLLPMCLNVKVKAETNTDFEVNHNVIKNGIVTNDNINEGDEFDLSVIIKNVSNKNMTEVYAIVKQNSSFYSPPAYASQKFIGNLNDAAQDSAQFHLKYSGTGNLVTIILKYKKDGDPNFIETEKNIYLNVNDSSDSSPSTPTDTSKYKPVLLADTDGNMPTFNAGRSNKFTFDVVNQSSHYTKDINVSFDFGDLSKYVSINKVKLYETIEKLNPKKSEEVTFDLSFKASAPEGTFPIKIKYDYKNAFNDSFTTEETIYIKIKNSYSAPNIQVDKIYLDKDIVTNGEILNLNIDLKNSGSLKASDLTVSVAGLDENTMSVYNDTVSEEIQSLLGYSTFNLNFPIMILNDAKTGNYPVNIEIKYEDYDGVMQTVNRKAYLYINVKKGENTPNIEVVKISKPNYVYQDRSFDLSINLENTGKIAADNVKIKISNESGVYPTSSNLVKLDTMEPEQKQDVLFSFITDKNAVAKYYPFEVTLEYEDRETGKTITETHYTGINIQEESKPSIPKIIIENYEYSTGKVIAGQEFELIMTLYNTSKSSDVRNIKITLTSSDGSFTPVESSSSLYVDEIPKNEKIQQSIKLMPKVDLTSKSYQMTVKVEYEGNNVIKTTDSQDKSSQITQEEVLSIPVFQEPRLEVSELNVPFEMPAGQEIPIYLDFYNMGRSVLYNLLVKVEGDFEGRDLNYFVGNFAQGSSDYYDVRVMAMNEGMTSGSVVFTFEDDLGNQHEIRKDFEVNILPMDMSMENPGEFGPEAIEAFNMEGMNPPMEKKSNKTLYFIIGGALIFVVVLIVIVRKRKKNKELTEDE